MSKAPPPAQHFFPTSDARPSHERQVTSRRAWRRGLPQAIPAANDNESPIARPVTAKREMDIEALVTWSYRAQLAHKKIQGPIDKFRFFADEADLLMNPADRRHLHIDAMIVHEAVTNLGVDVAAMVIEAALFGDWPQWMDPESSRPNPLEPSDRYDDHGWYLDADGIRREYLIRTDPILLSIPQEEYEQVGRKKMRLAKTTSWQKVPVRHCVIRWEPEPEYIVANNRMVAQWQTARTVLIAALRDEPGEARFRDHVLADVANDNAPAPLVAAANDNEPLAANDNEPAQVGRVA